MGLALKNLNRIAGLNAVYTYLSQEELDRCDFEKGETEGFVNYGLSLEGIQLSVILIENRQEGIVKMSFRSKGNFDVNQLAREHFNGGGHLNAAGGVSTTSLEATREKLHAVIQRYSSELS